MNIRKSLVQTPLIESWWAFGIWNGLSSSIWKAAHLFDQFHPSRRGHIPKLDGALLADGGEQRPALGQARQTHPLHVAVVGLQLEMVSLIVGQGELHDVLKLLVSPPGAATDHVLARRIQLAPEGQGASDVVVVGRAELDGRLVDTLS